MKKRILAVCAALFCLCAMLAACGKDSPAKGPQAVAEAMFNAPNEQLCSADNVSVIGLEVETTPEQREKAQEASEQMMENWESALGEYFAPNCLKPAMDNDVIYRHLAQCAQDGQQSKVDSVELEEEGDLYQNLLVHYILDGQQKEALVKFSLDKDGLITRVIAE